jgi:integrase/recombinase XerD
VPQDLIVDVSGSPLDLAIAGWLHEKAGRSGSAETRRAYAATLARFRAALQAALLELDGPPAAVALAAQGWAGQGDPAPASFNRRLAVLSSFYAYGLRVELLGANPIARVQRRRVQTYADAEALSAAAVRARLQAIDQSDQVGMRDYALLSVALETCRRVGELAALRWGQLRIADGRTVTLAFSRTKGGAVRRHQLSVASSGVLLRYLRAAHGDLGALRDDAAVWASASRRNPGAPLSARSLERISEVRLGIHFHAIRHTGAQIREQQGAKVSEIQAILGHSSLATTGRYLAALRSAEDAHAEGVAALLGIGEAK